MIYNWQAGLALLASVVVVSVVGKFLALQIPAMQGMRRFNREGDRKKLAMEKYPPVVKASERVGLVTNVAFYVGVTPFITTLEMQPWWKMLGSYIAILMLYDFLYYLAHRFWFHGKSSMRQIHALHHQARSPTHIDAYYVHPLETFIGIALFMVSAPILAIWMGPFNVITMAAAIITFTQLNIINHTHIDVQRFPFRTLSWITAKHAVHHRNMHSGNYATITLLYDKMFGTLE